ncbi:MULTISPECIES: superoxide dismutase [unclassified Kitasatospora]|uniref:SMP-30/gluconolactonase/LRE family protein n=1 Tax=unclassified Kitasatospora TaxID=2633591 RepID=UPI0033D5CC47
MRTSRTMLRAFALATVIGAVATAAAPLAAAAPEDRRPPAAHRPTVWAIPGTDAGPEGIARDPYQPYFYTGSTGDGAVYRGDLRTGAVEPFLAPGADGRATAVGMKVDAHGRLIIAGGSTGKVWVYDTHTRKLLHTFDTGLTSHAGLTSDAGPTAGFLNDLTVADDGDVYVTDSVQPRLYRIAADQLGGHAPATSRLPVFEEFAGTPIVFRGGFNLNGIVVTPDQRYVIVAHDNDSALYRIDRRTKDIRRIDLGGAGVTGDGLLMRGHTLYALSSVDHIGDNHSIVDVVRLDAGYASGALERRATNPLLDRPSTGAFDGDAILAVNFQWAVTDPHLPYSVVRVPLRDLT